MKYYFIIMPHQKHKSLRKRYFVNRHIPVDLGVFWFFFIYWKVFPIVIISGISSNVGGVSFFFMFLFGYFKTSGEN